VHSLDLVPPNPIHNPVEMDEDFAHVLQKLQATSTYPKLFKDAFGSEQITSVRFLQALSQFMLTLVTADSRYDEYRRGNANALSQDELAGMNLFHQKCAKCHEGDLTTDRGYHNNGTQATITDSGRYAITLNPDDIGKFKTPTLRNIEKTAPYMHTGRFNTLEQVLQHYASGTTYTTTLDTALIIGTQYGISMTADEQQKIILFLKTLTDEKFLHDQRFAEQ
jgi:cytochrome c peroxidase